MNDFRLRAREWKSNHFTISEPSEDTSRLLRKVADALDKLGRVQILDVTFCKELEGPSPEMRMTVYFTPEESPAE